MAFFSSDEIKQQLGRAASLYVENDMIVGLGSGTTASYFIHSLSQRIYQESLNIVAVASSENSNQLAKQAGLKTVPFDSFIKPDLTIDGADEIDSNCRLIKGKGGALLREKILATNSNSFLVIIESKKLVPHLGKCGVPLEILPYGAENTAKQLQLQGYNGHFRYDTNGKKYITDNGNYIFDISFPDKFEMPENDHLHLLQIPGILETGFFFLPAKILVGYPDGTCQLFQ